jgi:hypothetical protein
MHLSIHPCDQHSDGLWTQLILHGCHGLDLQQQPAAAAAEEEEAASMTLLVMDYKQTCCALLIQAMHGQ